MVEKPGVGGIDSDFAIVSGSLFGPEIFDAIEESMRRNQQGNTPRELVYTDAVNILLEQGKDCFAKEIVGGKYYDCGNKLEYLKAVVEFGLKHGELKDDFSQFLKNLF